MLTCPCAAVAGDRVPVTARWCPVDVQLQTCAHHVVRHGAMVQKQPMLCFACDEKLSGRAAAVVAGSNCYNAFDGYMCLAKVSGITLWVVRSTLPVVTIRQANECLLATNWRPGRHASACTPQLFASFSHTRANLQPARSIFGSGS